MNNPEDFITTSVWMSARDIQRANTLSTRSLEAFKNYPNAQYENTPNAHFVGKVGELAVDKFLYKHRIIHSSPCFVPAMSDRADIIIGNDGYEVKTWRSHNWGKLGRAITVNQSQGMSRKANFVIWVTYKQIGKMGVAFIEGWNAIYEIKRYEPKLFQQPNGRWVPNYQVPLEDIRHIRFALKGWEDEQAERSRLKIHGRGGAR